MSKKQKISFSAQSKDSARDLATLALEIPTTEGPLKLPRAFHGALGLWNLFFDANVVLAIRYFHVYLSGGPRGPTDKEGLGTSPWWGPRGVRCAAFWPRAMFRPTAKDPLALVHLLHGEV